MDRYTRWVGLFAALAIAVAPGPTVFVDAQSTDAPPTDPAKQPLVQSADLRYIGRFAVDASDGSGTEKGTLAYGGAALSVNPATNTLLFGGHVWHSLLCEVAIPDDFSRGSRAVQQCADVADGRLGMISPEQTGSLRLGGTLVYNNRLIVSGYVYYDAESRQTQSHFVSGTNLSEREDAKGPFRVGTGMAGFVSGYMGLVPPEWRAALGGPALTGNCCLAIISRTSSGPAISVFDPDDLGRVDPVPAKELVGYPLAEALAAGDSQNLLYNLSTEIKGIAFPSGTRSVLFFGRIGEGRYCYGGGDECKDPTNNWKGAHMHPYRHQVWAYDAAELLQVAKGKKDPWEVKPYATWQLREMDDSGSASIVGATYDQTTRRLYVTEDFAETPEVHVYEITGAARAVSDPAAAAARKP